MTAVIPELVTFGLTLYADGGCLNNGRPDASAYGSMKLYRDSVNVPCTFNGGANLTHQFAYGIGTNNSAELMTLINALKYCQDLITRGYKQKITICMDSRLAINAAAHGVKKPQASLSALYAEVRTLALAMQDQVILVWVPNEAIKMILGH